MAISPRILWRAVATIVVLTGSVSMAADFPNAFHVAGLPVLKSETRINVTARADSLEFERKHYKYSIPYAAIGRLQVFSTERHFEASSAGLFATGTLAPAGYLLILAKKKADVLVIDFQDERGGQEGVVFHVERGQGTLFADLMRMHGVKVEFPQVGVAKTGGAK